MGVGNDVGQQLGWFSPHPETGGMGQTSPGETKHMQQS